MAYESKTQNAATDELYRAILTLGTVEECYRFFDDVCTIREIIDISQRLQVAKLLKTGATFNQIAADTGASTATISRVSRCLNYGTDGYTIVLDRLEKQDKMSETEPDAGES